MLQGGMVLSWSTFHIECWLLNICMQEVMMPAAKDFRLAQKLKDATNEPLARRMQAAAFACSLSLGIATQDNVKILEAPLKVDAAQDMTIAGGCTLSWALEPLLFRG